MLIYSDSKDAENFNQFQLTEVILDESNSKQLTYIARVSAEGIERELKFECETKRQRDEWIECLTTALVKVSNSNKSQKEQYTLTLEFTKDKLGLLIKERFLNEI